LRETAAGLARANDGAVDGENSRGNCASAWAKGLPALTSARSVASRWRWRSLSASSAGAVSARSSCRPEPTRPASWRVQTASAVALKTGRVSSRSDSVGAPAWLLASVATSSGTSACARRRLRAARAVSASTVPRRTWPSLSRASNENAGMVAQW